MSVQPDQQDNPTEENQDQQPACRVPQTQAELETAYIEQQRRRHCPSCGEAPQVF